MLRCAYLFFSLLLLPACAQKVKESLKDMKYSAWEMVGYEKRDLFKKEVTQVKEEQEESTETFQDALEKLQAFYAFEGGKLEKEYEKLKTSYEDSLSDSENVNKSIQRLNSVAQDLFTEWKKEITQMSAPDLKVKSRDKLAQTQKHYQKLHQRLKKTEAQMKPVLSKLKDQVIFLKHNLNAKAVAGLKAESDRIENDIKELIKEMTASNKEASEFIKSL